MNLNYIKKFKIIQIVHHLAKSRGEEVYLIGGAIRDLFRGRPLGKDFDFVTAGKVEDLAKAVAGETGGHVFPLDEPLGIWRLVLKKGKKKTELDFSSVQGRDIIEDLKQRDFTTNSIALNLAELFNTPSPSFLDPLDGLADLRQNILRANSEESLRQDPLRMLRAFRFVFTLGLKMDQATLKLIQKNKNLIHQSAHERIQTELFTGLEANQAGSFLRALYQSGLLWEILPEIQGWENCEQDSYHDFPLLEHAFRTVEALDFILEHLRDLYPAYETSLARFLSPKIEEGISRRALLKWAALVHDSGKPVTRTPESEGQTVRFLDHDQEGQRINELICQRLKLSRKSRRFISELTRHHMRILSLSRTPVVTPRAKYRFFRDLEKEGIAAVLLALADAFGSKEMVFHWPLEPELPGDLAKVKEVADELLRYYHENFSPKRHKDLLNGDEIMKILGLTPGREVGIILAQIREAETAGLVRTKKEALEFIKVGPALFKDQGNQPITPGRRS